MEVEETPTGAKKVRTEEEIRDFWTKEVPVDVPSYLARIWTAVQQLASVCDDNDDDDDNDNDNDGMDVDQQVVPLDTDAADADDTTAKVMSAEQYVEQIARGLLRACRLPVLAQDTAGLPPPPPPRQSEHDVRRVSENDHDDDDDDEEEEEEEDNNTIVQSLEATYKLRRVDYLRLLLRAMKPIAMDVAAHVCSQVQHQLRAVLLNEKDDDDDDDDSLRAKTTQQQQQQDFWTRPTFILFSVWLPVAPHLTRLASDLFALEVFACPLVDGASLLHDAQQQLELVTAARNLCQYFFQRREQHVIKTWWDWTPIFQWCGTDEQDVDAMEVEPGADESASATAVAVSNETVTTTAVAPLTRLNKDRPLDYIIRWFAFRVAGYVLNLAGGCKAQYFKRHGVEDENVPWIVHPWDFEREELDYETLHLQGNRTRIWWQDEFDFPGVEAVRNAIPLHPYLLHVGAGLVFCKHNVMTAHENDDAKNNGGPIIEEEMERPRLVRTATTSQNLTLIGTAMCIDPNPPPMLLCAPNGAGKSSLVRELARLFHPRGNHDDQLLEIHVDEETDTKTLVGSYTATDIPGEFEWRPGALTRAVRDGKWVLFEDMDKVPAEIQASLQPLFKERLLPLGNGKMECCHPNFRLFGTVTTVSDQSSGGRGKGAVGKRLLHAAYWIKVFVDPLPLHELKEIALASHPTIPLTVVDSALGIFQALDQSGRDTAADPIVRKLWIGRHPSVRDVLKVLSRIANGIPFEQNIRYATESQRTLCMAESFDVFAAACPDPKVRVDFIRKIAAPTWGITAELAQRYIETRCPTILMHESSTEVGRVHILVSEKQAPLRTQSESFAHTNYALRLMESVGVCIRENEPTLLVGETGTGKTTILQQLALISGREVVVQNLSLQTDSTDLLGGYRPLEMQHVARKLYQDFVDLFTGTFSRKQNAEFLGFAATSLKKGQWKKLSQCFVRAAKLGLSKLNERKSDSKALVLEQWRHFSGASERFEQQRLACDSGLAFVFTEGALVDAIRTGKWVLLDEINLASSETLQRLCGLLDDSTSSLTLTERGDAVSIHRHPSFRLFAAMNPATDSGKKDIAGSVRARFTEIFVDELRDPVELRMVAARYISSVLPASDRPPEHTDTIISVVNLYLQCRDLADRVLVDGSGQRPRYTLRTLSRALIAARNIVRHQKLPLTRALYEGFQLAFLGPLDEKSLVALTKVIHNVLGKVIDKNQVDHPGRRPGGRGSDDRNFTLIKPFWIATGPLDQVDWSEQEPENGRSRFILIPSTAHNLRRLARAVASGPWPMLLEGPTSAGKTTLVEYIAARCGHHVVRINNHEHTDVQEYTGGFALISGRTARSSTSARALGDSRRA